MPAEAAREIHLHGPEPLGGKRGARLASAVVAWAARAIKLALAAGAVACVLRLSSHSLVAVLKSVSPWLFVAMGVVLVLISLGVAVGNRSALFFAVLFGVPLELAFWPLGDEDRALQRKARWLAGFVKEMPRSYNPAGAHLAYGAIAVKKTLKKLALRREKASAAIQSLKRRRSELAEERNRESLLAYRRLAAGQATAGEHSRREFALSLEVDAIDVRLLALRLEIQHQLVEKFQSFWEKMRRGGRISDELHQRAAVQFQQPPGEPPALLPNGLVRGPVAFVFEYGMFFGRLLMAVLFVATTQTSFLLWGLALFALDLYVIEPVVFKLHMSSLNLLLDAPGHKMADLRRYIDRAAPDDATFRVPITVPKFSSNPAWTELNAIIDSAARRAEVRPSKVTPFAMREGIKRTVIELDDGSAAEVMRSATRLRDALQSELAARRARFPLQTELAVEGRRVVIHLTDEDQKIWDLIGEDANQAFIYLWQNTRALGDSLTHLGSKFQPVFIFASNSKDADVIQYEIDHVVELQAWSDREHGGQVGFLYLLRGGDWYNFNARLQQFEEKDKDFSSAVPGFKKRLLDPRTPAREGVLAAIVKALDGKHLAAAFNDLLADAEFYRHFDGFDFDGLPSHLRPTPATLSLLQRRRAGDPLSSREHSALNRDLLLTALPMKSAGAFFKKVGNDISVQELLVTGKTRPTVYTDRRTSEHVQDESRPNYTLAWGNFARYTGLGGSNAEIHDAIVRGRDLVVESVPELGAIIDDKNHFAPGEIEKGLATMLHPENRHIVIGVPRINVTLPEDHGRTVCSEYILGAQSARESHNAADGLTKVRIFELSSTAYGKWFQRPKPYLAHYLLEVLNAAHALSHDFQQSYLVAGGAGQLAGFSEALYGPSRFELHSSPHRSKDAAPRK